MDDFVQKIKDLDIGRIEENVSLKKYTTYKVGGNARCIAYPNDASSLIKLIKYLKSKKITYKIIGNGSNLLFSDKEYNGVLIKLSELNDISFFGKNKIKVGAGYPLIKLSRASFSTVS